MFLLDLLQLDIIYLNSSGSVMTVTHTLNSIPACIPSVYLAFEAQEKSPGRWSYHSKWILSPPSPLATKQYKISILFIMARKELSCSLVSWPLPQLT